MTREFEEWYKKQSGLYPLALPKKQLFNCWQASRKQFKAKLLSDEMVEVILKAMYGYYSPRALVKINRAKAALEAIAGVI